MATLVNVKPPKNWRENQIPRIPLSTLNFAPHSIDSFPIASNPNLSPTNQKHVQLQAVHGQQCCQMGHGPCTRHGIALQLLGSRAASIGEQSWNGNCASSTRVPAILEQLTFFVAKRTRILWESFRRYAQHGKNFIASNMLQLYPLRAHCCRFDELERGSQLNSPCCAVLSVSSAPSRSRTVDCV